ncbi:DeoR/GlpR family DNA-binding transcription regulator [Leifsonia sp. LS-T14]|uniref:DeoR/GlpR family DNA-binding transcription regulator n=1 Tax=unclassified Leifsonia TaxID=2663824 RepID=UPI0035A572BF
MKKADRNRLILEMIESRGELHIADIAHAANVSEMTVRRDLESLEALGALTRVHGGAVSTVSRSRSPLFHTRSMRNQEQKERIGQAAASLIRDGETVILDAGSTTLQVARALSGRRNLRVLVLDLRAADCLADEQDMTVMVIGGTIRPIERSVYGPAAESALAGLHFDTFIMSAGGVDGAAGFTEYNPDDAAVKRAALASARRTIVVADSSKLGVVTFATVCSLSDVDVVVTDPAGVGYDGFTEAEQGGLQVVGA